MPANVVRTARDERLWAQAKKIAKDAGRDRDYAYVMGVYQRSKAEKGQRPQPSLRKAAGGQMAGHKYRSRTGTPGHYQYTYDEPGVGQASASLDDMMAAMVAKHGKAAVAAAAKRASASVALAVDGKLRARAEELASHPAVAAVGRQWANKWGTSKPGPDAISAAVKEAAKAPELAKLAKTELGKMAPDLVDAAGDAALKATGEKKPKRWKAILRTVLKGAAGPFVFGFLDNFMLYLAGAGIDKGLAMMGFSAAAVAGLGNAVSDSVGQAASNKVDAALEKVGLGEGETSGVLPEKTEKKIKNLASIGGVFAGAIAGMVPMLFGVTFGKSEDGADLQKAAWPPRISGYQPAPGSKRGAYRKRVGNRWHYMYPPGAFGKHPPSEAELKRWKAAEAIDSADEAVQMERAYRGGAVSSETKARLQRAITEGRAVGITSQARLDEALQAAADYSYHQWRQDNPVQKSVMSSVASRHGVRRPAVGDLIDTPTLGQRVSSALGRRPKGSGWYPIPGGAKGGFRKRVAGRWRYWYPGMSDQGGTQDEAAAHQRGRAAKQAGKQAAKLDRKAHRLAERAAKRRARDDQQGAAHLAARAHEHVQEADAMRRKHGLSNWARKGVRLVLGDNLAKAAPKPPGSGWQPIPGGKHGGFRRGAPGKYEYWYPGIGMTKDPHHADVGEKKRPKGKKPAAIEGAVTLDVGKRAKRRQEKGEGPRQVISNVEDLPPGFNDLSKHARAIMTADYPTVEQQMDERFGKAQAYKGDLKEAIGAHIDEMAKHGWIVPSNAERAKKMMTKMVEHGEQAGVEPKLLSELMNQNVRKLAHQEIEAARRTLGDHGVRHLAVNAEQGDAIFDALEKGGGDVHPKHRLMAYQVWLDHDMGYTIPAIAQGGFAVKDNYHPQASTVMAFQQREMMTKVFGNEKAFDVYVAAVANHSGSDINWKQNPFGSVVRLADNTHLFADKMPEVLFDSTAAVEAMTKIKLASSLVPPTMEVKTTDDEGKEKIKMKRTPEEKARFKALVSGIKSTLAAEVRKRDDLPDKTKDALLNAVKEIGELTPKFLISRLAGRSPSFEFNGTDMVCNIEQSNVRETIGQVFGQDQEDGQFVKLLKDYGAKPKDALNADPPPPHIRVGKETRGGINFRWAPPKDEHPAERRHAETMSSLKGEFDKLKGMPDGDEKNSAMDRFFGVEAAKSMAEIGALDDWLEKSGHAVRKARGTGCKCKGVCKCGAQKKGDTMQKDHSAARINKLADRVMGGVELDDAMRQLGDDDESKRHLLTELRSRNAQKSRTARIGSTEVHLNADLELASMLEGGEGMLGLGHASRHNSHGAPGLRKSVETLGGTIHQGEMIKPETVPGNHADHRESHMRQRVAEACPEFDADGTRGNGGLAEWFTDTYDDQVEVNVPYAMAKAQEPPTQVIDTDDPRTAALHRQNSQDTGRLSDIANLYDRE